MRAGSLRHKITIQQLAAGSPQQLANGEPDESWTDYLTGVSASIDPVTGKEPFIAQEHLSVVSHKVRIRYRAGITADMRISFRSQYYDIKAVLNWGTRDRDLLLLCEQGANQG